MIIPLVLDLFLWIGPRLEAQALYAQFEPNLKSISAELDVEGQKSVQDMSALLKDFLGHYNLFAWLSVGIVGVPAVNTSIDATAPLVTGTAPIKMPVGDVGTYLGIAIILSAVGLLVGGLFWAMLTRPQRAEPFNLNGWLRDGLTVGGQLVVLAVVTAILTLIMMFPLSI